MFYEKLTDKEINERLATSKDAKAILKRFLRLIGDVAEKRVFSKSVVQAFRGRVISVAKHTANNTTSYYSAPGDYATVEIIDQKFGDGGTKLSLVNNSAITLNSGEKVFIFTTSTRNMTSQNTFIAACIK